jgi:hypothetical protein
MLLGLGGCSQDPELQGNPNKTKTNHTCNDFQGNPNKTKTNHTCNDLGRDAGKGEKPEREEEVVLKGSQWTGGHKERRRRETGSELEEQERRGGREGREEWRGQEKRRKGWNEGQLAWVPTSSLWEAGNIVSLSQDEDALAAASHVRILWTCFVRKPEKGQEVESSEDH